jgi:anti-sigma factor RsiW
MTEQPLHPDDELVELALGDVDEPRRSQLIRHLVDCAQCRTAYDAIAIAVDAVLPAAPEIAPPVGFDQRVLTRIGAVSAAATEAPQRPARRRRLVIAAAAAVLAILLGGVVAVSQWGGSDQSEPPLAGDATLLRTSDGDVVGTVAVTSIEDEPVVVVAVSDPVVGVPYTCRVLLESGRMVDAGRWTVDEPEGHTWITHAPPGEITGMELVTDDGRVWSSAQWD